MIEGIGSRPPAMDPAMMKQMRDKTFDKLDTNKDGTIDAQELAASQESEESEQSNAIGGAKPRHSPAEMLSKIGADGDGDGKITKEEYNTAFDAFDQKMKSKLIEAQSEASGPPPASANDSQASLADLFQQLTQKIEDEKESGASTELQDLGERLGEYIQKLLQKA